MTALPIQLSLLPQRTTLTASQGDSASFDVGPRTLVSTCFRHEPPTPVELEHAIELIENALMDAGYRPENSGALVTDDTQIRRLPGLEDLGANLTRDQVEALFQRLADISLGSPQTRGDLPTDREAAAALLILRECMHHLGFTSIAIAAR